MTVFILILVAILIIIGYFADKKRDIKERAANIELSPKNVPNMVINPTKEKVTVPDIDIVNFNISPTKVGTINKRKRTITDKKPDVVTEKDLSGLTVEKVTED